MGVNFSVNYQAQVRKQLDEHFSLDELRTLCFEIGVDSDEISSGDGSKSAFTRNLISHLARRGRLNDLILVCEQARPNVDWRAGISKPNQPAKSKMEPKRPLHIFLCHASQDKPIVRSLYKRLIESGFDPWLDEEKLLGGQDWELEITKAIEKSHVIIVCLSEESVSKTGFVQKEIRFALDRALEQPEGAIFLIPLKITPCDLPLRLKSFQWVNYYEENGYQNLVRALNARADSLFAKD
jgi:TIR domain/Effector-associated domain 7